MSLLLAVALHADQKSSTPTFTASISGRHVTATGATPHGKVVFIGIVRFVHHYRVTVERFDWLLASARNVDSIVWVPTSTEIVTQE